MINIVHINAAILQYYKCSIVNMLLRHYMLYLTLLRTNVSMISRFKRDNGFHGKKTPERQLKTKTNQTVLLNLSRRKFWNVKLLL